MAESMQGLKRSHRCAEVSNALEGQKVTVMGWVQKSRNNICRSQRQKRYSSDHI